MEARDPVARKVRHLDIALSRDPFMRTLLRHLAGTLEEVVGVQEASGFISVVGQQMADEIGSAYREALGVPRLSRAEVAEVMEDLKRRIEGDFRVVEQSDDKIVLENRACPFGDKVAGRTSLCMMTSTAFGGIAADNLGYAKVVLAETIARGSPRCRIVVHLVPGPAADAVEGREYIGGV